MRIFIDTNGLLSYFAENSDSSSLEELEKLLAAKKVRFFYTEQSESEYLRNVGDRIGQTRDSIQKSALQLNYKPTTEDDTLQKTIREKVDEANKAFSAYQQKRKTDYETRAQKTDELITRILKLGERAAYTDAILERAKARHIKGNPPKKEESDSHGDAINWESLLEYADDDDLVLISSDGDYTEKGAKGPVLNRILVREWQAKTKRALTHYSGLGKFINFFEKSSVISEATITKEDVLSRPFLFDTRAAANALATVQFVNSSALQNISSAVSGITLPNILTTNSGITTLSEILERQQGAVQKLNHALGRSHAIDPGLFVSFPNLGSTIVYPASISPTATSINSAITLTGDTPGILKEAEKEEPENKKDNP